MSAGDRVLLANLLATGDAADHAPDAGGIEGGEQAGDDRMQ